MDQVIKCSHTYNYRDINTLTATLFLIELNEEMPPPPWQVNVFVKFKFFLSEASTSLSRCPDQNIFFYNERDMNEFLLCSSNTLFFR